MQSPRELISRLSDLRLLQEGWKDQVAHLSRSWDDLPLDVLLDQLVAARVLTPLQRDWIQAGKIHALLCGCYRLLAREANAPDTFRAEHIWLGHPVVLRLVNAASFADASAMVRRTPGLVLLDAGRAGDSYFFVSPVAPDQGRADADRANTPTIIIPPLPAKEAAEMPVEDQERHVLIVDDEAGIRDFCRAVLQNCGVICTEAADGLIGLKVFQQRRFDLVLLDVDMPHMSGLDVCRALRQLPSRPHLKVILFSGRSHPDELAQMLLSGANDYLTKPFSPLQLQARVQSALQLQLAQERSDRLNRDLLILNRELERHLHYRDSDLVEARNALVLALAKLAEFRDNDTGAHLRRLQVFSRRLAEEALHSPCFTGQLDSHFIDMLACCAPLHDIGKVGLPDHILLKPDKLTPEERLLMQTHTVIGAETLRQVARQHGFAVAFLQMAIDITRHHHERFDGAGYPDRLAGQVIPLSARIVAICDVYDALRSRRVYKPAFSHAHVTPMIEQSAGTQFDPALVRCFSACAKDFERLFAELAD